MLLGDYELPKPFKQSDIIATEIILSSIELDRFV